MEGDRFRTPVDDGYVLAVGRAVYVFSSLEWNAVWCCEKLSAGYLGTVSCKTSGRIARDLVRYASSYQGAGKARLDNAALEFDRLVGVRNALVHSNPGTAAGGAQRLIRDGVVWTKENVETAADEFAACGFELNAILHRELGDARAPSAR